MSEVHDAFSAIGENKGRYRDTLHEDLDICVDNLFSERAPFNDSKLRVDKRPSATIQDERVEHHLGKHVQTLTNDVEVQERITRWGEAWGTLIIPYDRNADNEVDPSEIFGRAKTYAEALNSLGTVSVLLAGTCLATNEVELKSESLSEWFHAFCYLATTLSISSAVLTAYMSYYITKQIAGGYILVDLMIDHFQTFNLNKYCIRCFFLAAFLEASSMILITIDSSHFVTAVFIAGTVTFAAYLMRVIFKLNATIKEMSWKYKTTSALERCAQPDFHTV
jgi:hypothetical protein